MFGSTRRTTQLHITADHSHQNHRCKNSYHSWQQSSEPQLQELISQQNTVTRTTAARTHITADHSHQNHRCKNSYHSRPQSPEPPLQELISQQTKVTRTNAARTHNSLPPSCLFVTLTGSYYLLYIQTSEGTPEKCEGCWGGIFLVSVRDISSGFQLLFCSFGMRLYCATCTLFLVRLS